MKSKIPNGFRVTMFSMSDNGYTEEGFIRIKDETIRISHNPQMLINPVLNQVCLAQEVMSFEDSEKFCKERLPEFVTKISPVNKFDNEFIRKRQTVWGKIKTYLPEIMKKRNSNG